MNIWSAALVVVYSSFVDWEGALRRTGLSAETDAGDVDGPSTARSRAPSWPLATVVGVMLVGAVWAGVTRTEAAWPFASYPSFTPARTSPVTRDLLVTAADSAGAEERLVYSQELYDKFSSARYTGLIRSLLTVSSPEERELRFKAFGEVLAREVGNVTEGDLLRIYSVVFSTLPREDGQIETLGRTLVFSWMI